MVRAPDDCPPSKAPRGYDAVGQRIEQASVIDVASSFCFGRHAYPVEARCARADA